MLEVALQHRALAPRHDWPRHRRDPRARRDHPSRRWNEPHCDAGRMLESVAKTVRPGTIARLRPMAPLLDWIFEPRTFALTRATGSSPLRFSIAGRRDRSLR